MLPARVAPLRPYAEPNDRPDFDDYRRRAPHLILLGPQLWESENLGQFAGDLKHGLRNNCD